MAGFDSAAFDNNAFDTGGGNLVVGNASIVITTYPPDISSVLVVGNASLVITTYPPDIIQTLFPQTINILITTYPPGITSTGINKQPILQIGDYLGITETLLGMGTRFETEDYLASTISLTMANPFKLWETGDFVPMTGNESLAE